MNIRSFFLILTLTLCSLSSKVFSLQWYHSYEEAVKKAQEVNLPLLLYFTGSDWCVYCMRLDEGALNTPEFEQTAGDRFIFVKLDFPRYLQLSQEETSQNETLRQQFKISGFPTLVLLHPKLDMIAVTGFLPLKGKEYADHLLSLIEQETAFSKKTESSKTLSEDALKNFYSEAMELGNIEKARDFLEQGLRNYPKNPFFQLESYRFLVFENKQQTQEAQTLRALLTEGDHSTIEKSKETQEINFQIALIDFSYAMQSPLLRQNIDEAITPLKEYLKSYEQLDKDNSWKIHLTIAKVYLTRGEIENAKMYTQKALELAPEDQKDAISQQITQMSPQTSPPNPAN